MPDADPLALFTRFTGIDGPVISPRGDRVAWTEVTFDDTTDRANHRIMLKAITGGAARAFTTGTYANAPAFSPDNRQLAYIANRGQGSRLCIANLDGGEPRELDVGRSPTSPSWSPDGRHIAFLRSVEETTNSEPAWAPAVIRDIYFHADGGGLLGTRRTHVFVLDVVTGKTLQVTRGDWHDANPVWVNDECLVFISNRAKDRWNQFRRTALWITRIDGRKLRRLTPEAGLVDRIAVTAAGDVVYTGRKDGGRSGDHRHILKVATKGKPVIETLLASPDLTPSHIGLRGSGLSVSRDGTRVWFLAGDSGTVPVWELETRTGRVGRRIGGDFQVTGFAESRGTLVYARNWSSELTSIHVQEGKSRPRRLARFDEDLRLALPPVRTGRIRYRSSDGQWAHMFVLKPPGFRPGRRYPLWITIHGGPHAMHPALDNPLLYQIQAALGYVVMLPNPRGSISYGETYMQACQRDWGGGDYEDIMAGVDWLLDKGWVDHKRLYVEGYSYGGIMTAWIVGHTNRFRAAVIGAPVVDQVSNFGTDDEPHFSVESLGGTPQQVPDEYRIRSALTYVDKVRTPVQLQHYEGDLRCPIGQSMQFYMALRFLGREVEFVRYPGGSHVGRTPLQWRDMSVRIHDWWQRHQD